MLNSVSGRQVAAQGGVQAPADVPWDILGIFAGSGSREGKKSGGGSGPHGLEAEVGRGLAGDSYLPANAEEGIAYPPLVHTYESLSPASTCRVCDLLDTLVNHSDAPVAFFEDYALLCYYCLNAPRAWISSLITGMDFLHILIKYFPMAGGLDSLFMPSRILAIDIQLHFYICRCFLPVSSSDMIRNANLGYYKLEFLKSILTGQSPNPEDLTLPPRCVMAHKVTSANEPNPLTGKRLSSCPLTRSGVTEVAQTAGRTPKMEEFVPWTVDNLKSQFEAVGLLMAHSYLPANATATRTRWASKFSSL